ncbi:hypothetical protein OG21DRAFT_1500930 [Imleria badia]|nr:hypothetical protein OG21DRAFT_1500930 [Imleria badia]
MSQESDSSSRLLLVSTLSASLNPQFRKEVDSITVAAGQVTREIHPATPPGGGYQGSFDPPLEVPLDVPILVLVHYRKTFIANGVVTVSLNPQEVLRGTKEEDGKHLYRKTEKKVDVVIGIQSLPSTASEVLASCSRFRVLIIGESGAGKSSLIHKVFGVTGVDLCDTTRGEASIEQEYIAPDNDHFIVHDSCGFEAADEQNLTTVRNFISSRRCRRDLKDQLHAVWLCLEIPYAGSRLLEAGVEKFLTDRQEILGNIPLIVVFTKLDLLHNVLEADALEKGQLLHAAALKECTLDKLDKLCLKPVRKAAANDSASVPHVAISTLEGYEESLAALVGMTTRNSQTYVREKAGQCIATLVQRVHKSLTLH